MPPIHQLIETHCRQQQSLLSQNGMTVREASANLDDIKEVYEEWIAPIINSRPFRLLEHDSKAQPASGHATEMLCFRPSVGELQVAGNVCFAPDSTVYQRPSWFAHYFYHLRRGAAWRPTDILRLAGSACWKRPGDGRAQPLVEQQSLPAPDEHAFVSDDVLESFLCTPVGEQVWDPGGLIPPAMLQWPPEDRWRWLQQLLTTFLALRRREDETLLLAAPSAFAALAFYGVLRLLPDHMTRDCGFSTYETKLRAFPYMLNATPPENLASVKSLDPNVRVCRTDPPDHTSPRCAYAIYIIELLDFAGIEVVDQLLHAMNHTRAIKSLEDLDQFAAIMQELENGAAADRFVDRSENLVRRAAVIGHFNMPWSDYSVVAHSPSIGEELAELQQAAPDKFRGYLEPLVEHLPLELLERQLSVHDEPLQLPDDVCVLLYVRYLAERGQFVASASPTDASDDATEDEAAPQTDPGTAENAASPPNASVELEERHLKIAKHAFAQSTAESLLKALLQDPQSPLSSQLLSVAASNTAQTNFGNLLKLILLSPSIRADSLLSEPSHRQAAANVLTEALEDKQQQLAVEKAAARSCNQLSIIESLLKQDSARVDCRKAALRIGLRAPNRIAQIVKCMRLPSDYRTRLLRETLAQTSQCPKDLEEEFYGPRLQQESSREADELEIVLIGAVEGLTHSDVLTLFRNGGEFPLGFLHILTKAWGARASDSETTDVWRQIVETLGAQNTFEAAKQLPLDFARSCPLEGQRQLLKSCAVVLENFQHSGDATGYCVCVDMLQAILPMLIQHSQRDPDVDYAQTWTETDRAVVKYMKRAKMLRDHGDMGELLSLGQSLAETNLIGLTTEWRDQRRIAHAIVDARSDEANRLSTKESAALSLAIADKQIRDQIGGIQLGTPQKVTGPMVVPDVKARTSLKLVGPQNLDPDQVTLEMKLWMHLPNLLQEWEELSYIRGCVIEKRLDEGESKKLARNVDWLWVRLTFRSDFWPEPIQHDTKIQVAPKQFPKLGHTFQLPLRDAQGRDGSHSMFMDGVLSSASKRVMT